MSDIYVGTERVDAFFAHHGIKGQKWGVRRFQNLDGSLTPAGRERYLKGDRRGKENAYINSLNKYRVQTEGDSKSGKGGNSGYNVGNYLKLGKEYTVRDEEIKQMIKDAQEYYAKKKTDYHYREKESRSSYKAGLATVAIGTTLLGLGMGAGTGNAVGAAVGAAGGAAVGLTGIIAGGVRLHQGTVANKKLDDAIKEIDNNPNFDKKTKLKRIDGEHSADQDMAAINPGYKNFSETTKSNCVLCTTAYDLRRRGYDVIAGGTDIGVEVGTSLTWYKDAKLKVLDSSVSTSRKYDEIAKQPEGSRGNLTVRWFMGGGHSMAYEIVNGEPIVRDCQTNTILTGRKLKDVLDYTSECRIMRTDNLKPNISVMRKAGVFYDGYKEKPKKTSVKHFENASDIYVGTERVDAFFAHHGIKGQKWGVRRFQNLDGSLTPAGRERYLKGERKSGPSFEGGQEKRRLKSFNRASERLQAKGLTKEQADAEVERTRKNLKRFAITAGAIVAATAATAATVYAVKHIPKDFFDKTIKAGTEVQTLSDNPDRMELGSGFYAAVKNADKDRYVANWGSDDAGNFKNKIVKKAKENVKVASKRHGEKTFNDLLKNDSEFKEAYDKAHATRDLYNMYNVNKSKDAYDEFNRYNLLDHQINKEENDILRDKFFKALSKKGYGAVADVNDARYSGYDTEAAIVFAKDKFGDKKVSQLTLNDIWGADARETGRVIREQSIKAAASYIPHLMAIGTGVGLAAIGSASNKRVQAQVAKNKEGRKDANTSKKGTQQTPGYVINDLRRRSR